MSNWTNEERENFTLMDLKNSSIGELRQLLLEKKISVLEMTEQHIAAVSAASQKLNAMTEDRFEAAREDARRKDQFLSQMSAAQSPPPLFGVPFTFKEMFAFAGMKQTLGSYYRKDFRAQTTATVLERLIQAGGIPLCSTNVPELGFWFECENVIYGSTKNPFDSARTSGGSSGGEGALIGSGASPFGIGSDIGGSIRIPAAFCGIFGHKPTNRRVPMTGHPPIDLQSPSDWKDPFYPITVAGPMSRKAEDLRLLMSLLSGPDGIDPEVREGVRLKETWGKGSDRIKNLKVYLLPSPLYQGAYSADTEVSDEVVRVAKSLKRRGAKIIELNQLKSLPELKLALDLWFMRTSETNKTTFHELLGCGIEPPLVQEGLAMMFGKSKHTIPAYLTAVMEKITSPLYSYQVRRSDLRRQSWNLLSNRLQELLSDSVLLLPAHPRVAPKLRGTYHRPFDYIHTGVWNAMGLPATVAPTGLIGHLPASVQIVSAIDNDDLTIGVAEVLGQELAFR